MSETVTTSGPLFDGRAVQAARDFAKELQKAIGEKAQKMVTDRMGTEFRIDEGKYVASIHLDSDDMYTYVHDMNAFVYGPWLEGDGSRNMTTRFKGYGTMRKISSDIQPDIEAVAEEIIPPYLERMNA